MQKKLLSIAIGSAAGMAVGRMLVYPTWQRSQTNISMAVAPSTKNYFTIGGAVLGGLIGVLIASRLRSDVRIAKKRMKKGSMADQTPTTAPQKYFASRGKKNNRPRTFTYTIDMDERGEFRAHVDNQSGKEVFDVYEEIFDDGYMKNKNDLRGLQEYLVDLGIMKSGDTLKKA